MNGSLRDKLIALSVSGHEDLLSLGYTENHLNDVSLRLSRELLGEGASVAYGGVLGVGDFMPTLQDAARRELDRHPSREGRPEGQPAPFVSYQPWPWYHKVGKEQRSWDQGTIEYRDVSYQKDKSTKPEDTGDVDQHKARALSRMRRWMAADADARIILGGKLAGFDGLMPGVLEEALFHLEAKKKKPLYVLGGFGGVAQVLAAAMREGGGAEMPNAFRKEKSEKQGKVAFDDLLGGFEETPSEGLDHDPMSLGTASESYDRLQQVIAAIRAAGLELGLANGLDESANLTLMESEDPDEIVRLVSGGLAIALA